jgi:putative membrane protein
MTGALLVGAGALYAIGVRRFDRRQPGRVFPRARVAAFLAGLIVLAAALVGPIDRLAAERFSWHMVQHLAILFVGCPLLLLGRPVLLLRKAGPPPVRRAAASLLRSRWVRALTHPVTAWLAFAVVLWATHFTSLYQRALASPGIHFLEHALYVSAGLLFWTPVVAAEPSPHRVGHGPRLLYLFLAAPAGALVASTLFQAERVLYPAYAGPGGLADQRDAAAIMWIGEGLLVLVAVLVVGASWARHERSVAERADLLAEQGAENHPVGPGAEG